MELRSIQKSLIYQVVFLILAVVFCTYLRVSLLIIYPLVVIALYYLCNWRLSRNAVVLFCLILLSWMLSLRHGLFVKYNLVSFYYYVPFLLLIFAVPPKNIAGKESTVIHLNLFRLFMNALSIVVLFNNVPGLIQYGLNPGDDNFVGLYGTFTVSQNGLSLLNAIVFFYHLTDFQFRRKKISLILAVFFLCCCVLGFYGAGQMALIAALILTYLKVRKKSILQLLLITCLTLTIVVMIMQFISPRTLVYNVAIIEKFLDPLAPGAPRKIMAFRNYLNAYPSNFVDFLFGSGPGTFNSRSAFMVGSPSYFNVDLIKSNSQPFYFKNYAYPLWNETNTGPYDGFMNQPFSSLLALLGEYGLFFTILLFALLFKKFTRFNKLNVASARQAGLSVEAQTYRFCSIFIVLLLIIDNYVEYPEIIGLLIIVSKLCEQEFQKTYRI